MQVAYTYTSTTRVAIPRRETCVSDPGFAATGAAFLPTRAVRSLRLATHPGAAAAPATCPSHQSCTPGRETRNCVTRGRTLYYARICGHADPGRVAQTLEARQTRAAVRASSRHLQGWRHSAARAAGAFNTSRVEATRVSDCDSEADPALIGIR